MDYFLKKSNVVKMMVRDFQAWVTDALWLPPCSCIWTAHSREDRHHVVRTFKQLIEKLT